MGEDYDREAKRWKSSWEHEHQQMKAEGLDPSNPVDVTAYRDINGRPDDFTVLIFKQTAIYKEKKKIGIELINSRSLNL